MIFRTSWMTCGTAESTSSQKSRSRGRDLHTLANFATRHADGWAALMGHAAWQGTVVGLVALVIVALGRRCASPVRYWILVLALIKFAMPPMTAAPMGLFGLVTVSHLSVGNNDPPPVIPPLRPLKPHPPPPPATPTADKL